MNKHINNPFAKLLAKLIKISFFIIVFKYSVSLALNLFGCSGIGFLSSAGILSLIMVVLWLRNQFSLKNAHLYVR